LRVNWGQKGFKLKGEANPNKVLMLF